MDDSGLIFSADISTYTVSIFMYGEKDPFVYSDVSLQGWGEVGSYTMVKGVYTRTKCEQEVWFQTKDVQQIGVRKDEKHLVEAE